MTPKLKQIVGYGIVFAAGWFGGARLMQPPQFHLTINAVGEKTVSVREAGQEVAHIDAKGKCYAQGAELNCREWTKRYPLKTPAIYEMK